MKFQSRLILYYIERAEICNLWASLGHNRWKTIFCHILHCSKSFGRTESWLSWHSINPDSLILTGTQPEWLRTHHPNLHVHTTNTGSSVWSWQEDKCKMRVTFQSSINPWHSWNQGTINMFLTLQFVLWPLSTKWMMNHMWDVYTTHESDWAT